MSGARSLRIAIVLACLLLTAAPAAAITSYYPPLSSQVDLSSVPADFARPAPDGGPPIGERIRVKQFLYEEIKNATGHDIGAHLTLTLIIAQGFELQVPGLESVASVVLAQGEMQAEAIMREEHALDPAEDYPFILKLRPPANLISLRFKSDVLKPVQPVTFQPYPGTPPFPELQLAANLEIRVRYSWDGDADFELVDSGGLRPTLTLSTPVMIGDTGMVLEVQDAEIDFSRTSSAAGVPPSWIGVRFRRLAINFTNGLGVPRVEAGPGAPPPPAGISVADFSIGSGGVSGGITGTFQSPGPNFPLFGSNFEVRTIGITLDQGALTAGAVSGVLQQFPYFQNPVQLSLNLSLDGNFKVALAPDPTNPGALLDLTAPGVLVFHVEAFSLEKKLELYTWKMSGKINIDAISSAPADAIAVNGLSITSNGDVALDGGWLVLPGKKTIDFRGFGVELAEIGFGSEEPSSGPPARKWVGFSGGIQLSSGFDAAARFKKLQFVWPGGAAAYDVRLSGIEIDFRRPGVISFTGALDFFEDPAAGTEGFAGAVACNVEAIRLAISGRLVVGRASPPAAPQFPFFYVDLAVSLPAGVPLFPGVSLYGFLGQFAYNVNPNIEAFTTPLDWFHAHTVATNLLSGSPPPWRARDHSFAVGAGALVGTTPDDGFSANAKIAVTVALPGPVVLLQGAANIVHSRGDLLTAANPNFTCLAVFDGNNNTFLLNIGAYYSVANLIVVSGQAEAFFNLGDPNDWHVWIGKDQPETRRIRAEVLSFLKASSYFMIDPASFKNGAKAGYDAHWRFGPLRVTLVAFFAYDMHLFYRPVDVWGIVQVKGELEISAFGIGIGLSANASLEGETPKPFFVEGTFHVKLSLPWPLPDPEADVRLRWEEQAPKDPLDEWMGGISIEPRKVPFTVRPDMVSFSGATTRGAPPATINTSELCSPGSSVAPEHQSEVNCAKPLVPLDVVLVAAFQRPTNDVSGLGFGNPFNSVSPRLDAVKDTQFRYDLNSFALVQAHKGGSVLTFDTPLAPLFGVWPAVPGGATPAALSLRLLSRNPVDIYKTSNYLFYDSGTKGWTEWALGTYGGAYCGDRPITIRDPGAHQSLALASNDKCNVPPTVLSGDDFILPPYSAFRLTVDGDVTRNDPGSDRIYRNTAIFHTEGPPLDIAPYVEMTFPPGDRRPHYRSYDVGLRFKETYMDLMYRQAGQDFQLQVLDDNDQPLRLAGSPVAIAPDWDQAATHVPRPTESDWLQFLRDHGVPVDSMTPKDDRVFGRVSAPAAIRGNERYRIRVWLQDPRLSTDARLTDAAWLKSNPVRFIQGNRVVLYEFPLLYSRFDKFEDLVNTYPGNYVETPVNNAANRTTIATLVAHEGGFVAGFPPALTNGSATELGLFLRHALSPGGPDSVGEGERNQWIGRAPGYSGKPEQMTDAERNAVLGRWADALEAYEKVEKELGIETFRKPLPKALEISPLKQGSDVIGFLFELPEAIDFTRIELAARQLATPWAAVQVVPNRDNTRFFVLRSAGGAVQTWSNGLTIWRFRFHRAVGDRYPQLRHPDGLDRETAFVVLSMPNDTFTPETP